MKCKVAAEAWMMELGFKLLSSPLRKKVLADVLIPNFSLTCRGKH